MSSADVDKAIEAIEKRISDRVKQVQAIMNEEVSKEMDKVNDEFVIKQKEIVRKVFNKSVQEWYDAYDPVGYRRRFSLFNLLADFEVDKETGQLDYDTAEDLIDKDKMAPNRHGFSEELYETVFEEGYHGGARYITDDGDPDKWGYHPDEGTPYWRTAGWVEDDDGNMYLHRFGRWYSRPAFKSEAPLKIFKRKLADAEAGEMFDEFKKISNEHNETAMKHVRERLAKL